MAIEIVDLPSNSDFPSFSVNVYQRVRRKIHPAMLQRYCVNFDDDDLYATVYVERMVNELRQKRGCSQPLQCRDGSRKCFPRCAT